MAKSNLFNRDVRANKSPRNAFDMSYSTLFSSPCGLLQPAYVQEVKKGDKLKLGLSNVTRTRPLNTSAFMAFDEKIDFWYVPNYLLWSPYDEWRIRQSYPHSSLALLEAGQQNLLPYTSYSSLSVALSTLFNLPYVSGSIPSRPEAPYYNLNSALRYLDLFMYGFPTAYDFSNFKGTLTETSNPNPSQAAFVPTFYNMISENNIYLNYFRLAAFQCIYMHHYRNEEYEKLDPTYYNMDSLFADGNADNSVAGTAQTNSSPQYLVAINSSTPPSGISKYLIEWRKLLIPRYKNWRKDVFTSAKPNSGFSSVSGISQNVPQFGSSFAWSSSNTSYISSVGSGSYTPGLWPLTPVPFPSSSTSHPDTSFDNVGSQPQTILTGSATSTGNVSVHLYPQQILNLMAQDKFLRSSVYADKNLSSQIKALFGDDYEDCHCPSYLGSYSSTVNISDVTATSAGNDGDTSDLSTSLLGEIAGKGYNTSGKDTIFSRNFDYDGIVIGVHYLMPRNNYDSSRINLFNTKLSSYDYFYPQFDGLGMQPVYMFERNFTSASRNGMPVNSLFGYAPRFHEYKQRTNEVHSSFQFNQSDSDWTLSNNGFDAVTASDFVNYKIMPNITDRIFGLNWDSSLASDPFQCYFHYDVTLVSDMEVYGTPSI